MDRSEIKNAPYNPRKISDSAKKKLKDNLATVGLLGPVKVNRTTGNMFSGHQRLACLDVLEGSPNYSLDVAVCKLSIKREREQNIFENAPSAQGEWDLDALALMVPELNLDNTGLEQIDLEMMFDGTGISIFDAAQQPPEIAADVGILAEIGKAKDAAEADDANDDASAQRKASADAMAEMRKTSKSKFEAEDTERYLVLLFANRKAREDAAEALGLERSARYAPGESTVAKLRG